MIGFWLLVMPFVITFGVAYGAGVILRRRFPETGSASKIVVAGSLGVIAPVVYLWLWQTIEVWMREAAGDESGYMGPMVLLVYGFPLFLISSILSFVLAGFAVRREK